ncbi:heparin lyase I family protein [Adhaeribacter swui]|uniref:Heparin lyase I family protein n=1 Tax=Adhaeribacter swui TaxID=2086471 RepID=A0A7G7G592_9BACT|nr:polysaccharide lyase [Adhaeribacter swui]QNF32326.1 heparin lyase I family protein [Adhaeribacter swui]
MKYFIIFFILAPLYINVQHNNLLLEATFENSSDLKKWISETCSSSSIILTDSISRFGKQSARFELNKTDCVVANGKRSELVTSKVSGYERWYGMSIFFPNNYSFDSEPEIVTQWHEIPDFDLGETWRSPPISLQIQNDSIYVVILWATQNVNSNKTISGYKKINLGLLKKNSWNDWVFHIRFSYQTDGLLEIWNNDEQVLRYQGPNSYNDVNFPYFKIGIYKWTWLEPSLKSTINKRVLYYDEVKIGNENIKYKDITPNKN